jgi:hypothetical protein
MALSEIGNIPEYAKAPTGYPAWAGVPRQYRFDGRAGIFRVGSEDCGNYLVAQIFDWRWQQECRWGRESQYWLDLAFVDLDGCVAILPLKKDSAINLLDSLINLRRIGVRPEALLLALGAVERAGEDGPWYVTEVTGREFAGQVMTVAAIKFAEGGQMRWILTGEIE